MSRPAMIVLVALLIVAAPLSMPVYADDPTPTAPTATPEELVSEALALLEREGEAS